MIIENRAELSDLLGTFYNAGVPLAIFYSDQFNCLIDPKREEYGRGIAATISPQAIGVSAKHPFTAIHFDDGKSNLTVGRKNTNDIRTEHPIISRNHIQLRITDEGYFVDALSGISYIEVPYLSIDNLFGSIPNLRKFQNDGTSVPASGNFLLKQGYIYYVRLAKSVDFEEYIFAFLIPPNIEGKKDLSKISALIKRGDDMERLDLGETSDLRS